MDMKSISQKLQDDIRAIMEAGLHPNQQKIDVHEPEKDKITAHDFKKLRAMKKDSNGKITKEDTEMVNELSKKTLGSYIKKNVGDQRDLSYQHGEDPEEYESDPESVRKADNRETGLKKAVKRLTKEDSVQEEEKKKVVSPFDYKNYKSEIPKKPGELTGHDSKKISTGTVYTKKPVKEEVEQKEYTFAEYLDAARAQYEDEDAVLVANEAFKNKDITLFSDQSQSPEA